MNKYSIGNPPPVKVGDLLYLRLENESGFGIITDIYTRWHKGSNALMMKVYWSNAKCRFNQHQEHDIYRVCWNNMIDYHGEQ